MDKILELKQQYLELKDTVENLSSIISFIKDIPLTTVAKNLDISRQTLLYHIENNYKPQVDFYKQNGKIYISVGILQSIKAHYDK